MPTCLRPKKHKHGHEHANGHRTWQCGKKLIFYIFLFVTYLNNQTHLLFEEILNMTHILLIEVWRIYYQITLCIYIYLVILFELTSSLKFLLLYSSTQKQCLPKKKIEYTKAASEQRHRINPVQNPQTLISKTFFVQCIATCKVGPCINLNWIV